MGTWSAGLYASDFALDFRSTVAAVTRLPFEGDRLLELLREVEPHAADDAGDADHGTFWLVVADQFAKRGIVCDAARERALDLIDDGTEVAAFAALGATARDLEKRRAMLRDLAARLRAPRLDAKRRTLSKPQAFGFDIGELARYPVSARGESINPYAADKHFMNWSFGGYGACCIVARGRAFGFLTWYVPVVLAQACETPPVLGDLPGRGPWTLGSAGTCSALHHRRRELESLGVVALDEAALARAFARLPNGIRAAASDIGLSLETIPVERREHREDIERVRRLHRNRPRVARLDELIGTAAG